MSTIVHPATPHALSPLLLAVSVPATNPDDSISNSASPSASLRMPPTAYRAESRRHVHTDDMRALTVYRDLPRGLCEPMTDIVQLNTTSAPVTPTPPYPPNSPAMSCISTHPATPPVLRCTSLPHSPLLRQRDFLHSEAEEPHAARRRAILERYPEIKLLMKPEPLTKWIVLATVALQVFMAAATTDWHWPAYLAAVYIVGATANHSLLLAIHECSHNLAAERAEWNKVISIVANLAIGVPYCICFPAFHRLHHTSLGDIHDDTDLPSELEVWAVTKTATCRADHSARKGVYLLLQIFWYALRPVCMQPGLVKIDAWLVVNWAVQLTFNAAVVYVCGAAALWYLLLCTFLCGGLHPSSGHYLEHFVMDGSGNGAAETTSYYGILNYVTYNVGAHEIHHDLPNLPWSQLKKVRKIASEFYDDHHVCKSWPGAIARFIFDDSVGLNSRVRRGRKAD